MRKRAQQTDRHQNMQHDDYLDHSDIEISMDLIQYFFRCPLSRLKSALHPPHP
jgi:hypothetical protein